MMLQLQVYADQNLLDKNMYKTLSTLYQVHGKLTKNSNIYSFHLADSEDEFTIINEGVNKQTA